MYFMVTKEERAQIEQRMKEAGIRNLGAYLRRMALNGYLIHTDLSGIREMSRLLRITSDNMNQIAKRANETRSIYLPDIEDLQRRYQSLWKQMKELLETFTRL